VPAGLPHGSRQYGVREGLGRLAAPGAGYRGVIIPGQVGVEVALPRPDLVVPSGIQFGETHEGVGPERGGERIPGRSRGPGLSFFNE